ncbi:MAG: SNF2-related protein [Ostreibacterium sp.]
MPLTQFLADYQGALLQAVQRDLPPLFNDNKLNQAYEKILTGLARQPLGGQREKIHAVIAGLIEQNLEAVLLNGEMGTGKTYMSIAAAAVYHKQNPKPILVMCPPHLVYKWRREILATIGNAKVIVINGSDAINKLLKLRDDVIEGRIDNSVPNFVVIGRVRMRMGFHWKPAYSVRKMHRVYTLENGEKATSTDKYVACPSCGHYFYDSDNNEVTVELFAETFIDKQYCCQYCKSALWMMHHRANDGNDNKAKQLKRFLKK